MNKVLGWLILVVAAIYLAVSLTDFLPKYTAVPELVKNQKQLGLSTTTTNMRFHIAQEMIVDAIVVALLVVLGWWLTTLETQQYAYLIIFVVVVIALGVLWSVPLLPFRIARLSPQGAFYYAQVKFEVTVDTTAQWVTVPRRKGQRVALTENYQDPQLVGKKEVVLEFADDATLSTYGQSRPPVTILGRMKGTRNLGVGKYLYTVPGVQVLEVNPAQ